MIISTLLLYTLLFFLCGDPSGSNNASNIITVFLYYHVKPWLINDALLFVIPLNSQMVFISQSIPHSSIS